MSIASQGGSHTVDIYKKVTALNPNNSPADAYSKVASNVSCMVQNLSVEKSLMFSQRGKDISAMITFWSDPGLDVNVEHVFRYINNRGTAEIHEFQGFNDESNLGRVFVANTNRIESKAGTFGI